MPFRALLLIPDSTVKMNVLSKYICVLYKPCYDLHVNNIVLPGYCITYVYKQCTYNCLHHTCSVHRVFQLLIQVKAQFTVAFEIKSMRNSMRQRQSLFFFLYSYTGFVDTILYCLDLLELHAHSSIMMCRTLATEIIHTVQRITFLHVYIAED